MIASLVVAATLAAPQAAASQIYGEVLEAGSGTPIAGATLGAPETGQVTTTDADGTYRLEHLAAGLHTLRVSRAGYGGRELQIYVPAGSRVHLRIELAPRPIVLPSLWVRGAPEAGLPAFPGADRVEVELGSRTVGAADARLSILPGGPDFLAALIGGSVSGDPESPTALHLRGGDAHQTGVLIDGAPSLVPYHVGGALGALAPEAIAAVELTGAAPSASRGGTLAGPIEIRTAEPPGDRARARGSFTPQAIRTAVSVPVGSLRLLASARRIDPTILSLSTPAGTGAEATDAFGKVMAPLAGGSLEAFGFWTRDRIGFAAFGEDGEGLDAPWAPARIETLRQLSGGDLRNQFGWSGHTAAATWSRSGGGGAELTLQAFSSGLEARSLWLEQDGVLRLESERALSGLRGEAVLGVVSAGLSFEDDDLHYRARERRTAIPAAEEPPAGPALNFDQKQRRGVAFVEARPNVSDRLRVRLGLRGSVAEGRAPLLEPRLAARFDIGRALGASIGYARTIQDVQSLRNPEVLTARLFAAEPPIGSRQPGVPAARADEVAAALDVRPWHGLSARLMAYERRFEGLVLVGPATSRPFALRPQDGAIGAGRARGLELSARWRRDPWWVGVDYGLASTTRSLDAAGYHPGFGTLHSLTGRLALEPADDLVLHLSFVAYSGRRTTAVEGLGEWETCQALGGGCEIYGLPARSGDELNTLGLPAYVRLDAGVRKGWRLELFGREASVEGFLRLGNLMNRANALGYSRESASSPLAPVSMLGFTAIAAGIDWTF